MGSRRGYRLRAKGGVPGRGRCAPRRQRFGGGHLLTLPVRESVEELRRKPARMNRRPSNSPAKNREVMPKRVRPLDRLGMKAPTAIRTLEATRAGRARVRQKLRALMT